MITCVCVSVMEGVPCVVMAYKLFYDGCIELTIASVCVAVSFSLYSLKNIISFHTSITCQCSVAAMITIP